MDFYSINVSSFLDFALFLYKVHIEPSFAADIINGFLSFFSSVKQTIRHYKPANISDVQNSPPFCARMLSKKHS